MASAPTLHEVDCLLNCIICLGPLTNAKLLQCGHNFCLKCLTDLPDQDLRSITCPVCRRKTNKPPRGLSGLTDDFRLNQIKDGLLATVNNMKKQLKPTMNAPPICSACWLLAQVRCLQCHQDMCEDCLNKHNIRKDMGHHSVLRIRDFSICDDHGKDRSHVCHDCKSFICSTCMIDKCNQHTCMEIGETIRCYITAAKQEQSRDAALEVLNDCVDAEQKISNKLTSVKQEIRKRYGVASNAIKIERDHLLNDVTNLTEDALRQLVLSRKYACLVHYDQDDLFRGIPKELLDVILDAGRPVSEPQKRVKRFLTMEFVVKRELEPAHLGELEFSEERNPMWSFTCPLGQVCIGVACLCLFSYSAYYESFQRREWTRWEALSSMGLGMMYVICYFVYCHILYKSGLAKIKRTPRRIGKGLTLLLIFFSMTLFVYIINYNIQWNACSGHGISRNRCEQSPFLLWLHSVDWISTDKYHLNAKRKTHILHLTAKL